jgi:hypothetical protein
MSSRFSQRRRQFFWSDPAFSEPASMRREALKSRTSFKSAGIETTYSLKNPASDTHRSSAVETALRTTTTVVKFRSSPMGAPVRYNVRQNAGEEYRAFIPAEALGLDATRFGV